MTVTPESVSVHSNETMTKMFNSEPTEKDFINVTKEMKRLSLSTDCRRTKLKQNLEPDADLDLNISNLDKQMFTGIRKVIK